ncbi:hypothetical protein AK812_SmicGene47819, partial [Symbiodinium microadriaticum]
MAGSGSRIASSILNQGAQSSAAGFLSRMAAAPVAKAR